MKKLFLLSVSLLISSFLLAQSGSGGVIRGKIVDGGDQKIIDAATVSLYKEKDSALVKVNITDKDGNFEFDNVKPGKYFVQATSVGHLIVYSQGVTIHTNEAISIGDLKLEEKAKTLAAVTVSARKPFIERKLDRTVINVDASITNAGTNALEVLEKSPGVSVDKDGNISLRGKAGVMVMVDGRPSYLSGQELANLLRNTPSSNIDQIEIMTNPSAKFDAAGNSGIINIKTRKIRIRGINGSLSLSALQSQYTKTNNSLNLNYRTSKVNLFGNYSFMIWNGHQDQHIIRKFNKADSKTIETIFDQVNEEKRRRQGQNFKAGIDFFATSRTTVGAVFSGLVNAGRDHGINTNYLNDSANQTDSIVIADNSEKRKLSNMAANVNLRHLFDSSGKEFTIDLDYANYDAHTSQLLLNEYLAPDHTPRRDPSELTGRLPSLIHIYSAKTDFTLPLNKSTKIETGLKSSYVTTDNDALYQVNSQEGWVTDEGKTNHFIYKEYINAAYINFSREVAKWSFQAGLRAENTLAKGHQLGNASHPDSAFTKKYTNLFPTAYVSYALNDKNTFSANYGRRIDRPDYEDLNPFYYFIDEYTYEVGNTLLQPQFTDNFELSHTYKGFLTTTLSYSHTHNAFTPVLKQLTSERKTFQTKENLASKQNAGIEVSANFPVISAWSMNIYASSNYTSFSGQLNGGQLEAEQIAFTTNISNQFKFKKGWSAELSGFYRSRGIEGQIVINPMWRMDAGVQKLVLKNKGSLKLGIRDIFNTQLFSGNVKYQDIDVYIKNVRDSRTVSLTFSYRFGKPVKNPVKRASGVSDEQNRIKTGN